MTDPAADPVPDHAPGTPGVVRTRAELAAVLGGAEPGRTRAAVLTMGALHEGHLSLVRHAARLADDVVVTIFVNPLQFGPTEDFDRYPRDLAGDLALLAGAGADVVFAPDVAEVYPDGPPTVRVCAGRAGERFEGAVRPGHFDGVLTVVLKLLNLVAPDVAVFGQKDAQQVMAVRRMVRDLDVPVEVVAAPTVRDDDGVALSSRNAYLSEDERVRARALWRALTAGAEAAASGASASDVVHAAGVVLAAADGVQVDYLVLLDPETADEIPAGHTGPAVLAVAARVGSTRLLDNVPLEIHP